MDFNLTQEQQMLLDGAQRFVRENYGLERRREIAAGPGLDYGSWSSFAELGWLMLPFTEEHGGLCGAQEDIALLMTAFGAGLVTEPYVSTAILSGNVLAEAATPAALAVIQRIAAGETFVALAHDETAHPAPVDTVPQTLAQADGEGFRLEGLKRTVLDGPSADLFIVSASLDGELALFLTPNTAEGLVVRGYAHIDGARAADVELSDVRVSADALVARGAAAAGALTKAIECATLANLAQAVGSIETVLSLCSEYLKTRHQFGRPLGSFQALQHIMAQMFVEAQEARSILYFAIASMRAQADERAGALRQARIVIGEASQLISRQAIQLHGGYGMTDEFAVGHHFKRLLTLEKTFGDTTSHLARQTAALRREIQA